LNNKDKYRELCKIEPTIPIFSKDWWLDAVVGEDNWDVILVEKGEEIVASLPFVTKRKFLIRYITMPVLTQTAGIWMRYPKNQKYANRLSFEKEISRNIIEGLPKFNMFSQNFHHTFTNWLPFYWKDFKQHTRYTYIIEDLHDHDEIYKNFKSNIKTDIKKALTKVRVAETNDLNLFWNLIIKTFRRQRINVPYSFSLLQKLDKACVKNNSRKLFIAQDSNGEVHAGVYIVWDDQSAYYLISGGDPELRNSGATSLLLWEAIKFSSTVTKSFDFEGSMIQPIERFFSAFGAVQKPYFNISKTNSKLLKIRSVIREVKK
jgi:hypothetical protein